MAWRCSLDSVLVGVSDQAKTVIESIRHVANHAEVRDRSAHSPAILQFKTGAAALVPPTKEAISLILRGRRFFNPTGGYDVSRLYHTLSNFDTFQGMGYVEASPRRRNGREHIAALPLERSR